MSKYSPKGIPAPTSSFVRNELTKFEKYENSVFVPFVHTSRTATKLKSNKQNLADWLNDEISWFSKELDNYKKKTYYPAQSALAAAKLSRNYALLGITGYKQAGNTLTLYVSQVGLPQLPGVGDWIFIKSLSAGDSSRWGEKDGAVLQITHINFTNSNSPYPAWSFTVTVPTLHSDSAVTTAHGNVTLSTVIDSSSNYYTRKSYLQTLLTYTKNYRYASENVNGLEAYLKELNTKAGLGANSGTNNSGGQTTATTTKVINDTKTPTAYNIPSVKWAYFNSSGTQDDKGRASGYASVLLNSGGSPASSNMVAKASELWASANKGAHKGMFQTYSYWKTQTKSTKSLTESIKDPNLPSWYLGGNYESKKYGFQFLYNPGTVQMGWGGTPNVDPGLYMSGKDATPYITPSQTSSWISFDLIINRMPDMALLNSKGPLNVLENLESVYGISHSHSETAPGGQKYLDELTSIQELGTMYDIEYLLSTLVGFREFSALRGRYTADFGFLLGVPVELHLGKQMRYIGTILDFNVTHTIFSEGMVPIFTNLSITFSRRVEPFANSKGKSQIDGNGSLLSSGGSLTNKDANGHYQTFLR